MKQAAQSGGATSPHTQPAPFWLWRVISWKPFGTWTRLKLSRREVAIRGVLSVLPLIVGIGTFVASVTSSQGDSYYFWSGVWLFVAWRFFRLGLYTSRWGVRICNPMLTYWYPWSRIHHFEIIKGEESFLPKSDIIALVTRRGRRRSIFSLSSTVAFFSLTKAHQSEILNDLNRKLLQATSD
jgi:hypothetical protein